MAPPSRLDWMGGGGRQHCLTQKGPERNLGAKACQGGQEGGWLEGGGRGQVGDRKQEKSAIVVTDAMRR